MPLSRYACYAATALWLVAGLGAGPRAASADHTPDPVTVNLPGSFQSELGCPGDWQPDCPVTHLSYDAVSDRWVGTFTIPAGAWEFKVVINDSWDENYGANGVQDGPNIPLSLTQDEEVTFSYDHHTHRVTTSQARIVVAPGSFQSELGCPGDWQPDCLLSQLLDDDKDGIFHFTTTQIPVGSYEFKIAIGLSWDENYGADGVRNGPNIPFEVPVTSSVVTFSFDSATNVPTVTVEPPTPVLPASWGRMKVIYR